MDRRTYSSEFKLRVVLEALQSDGTDAEVARAYDVHPVTLSNWKTKLKENGSKAFGGSDELKEKKEKIAKLERMVGQKEVEIALLKNFLGEDSYTATGLPVGTHQFRLNQVDLDGSSTLIDPVTVDIQMQEALSLKAPAPNPASTSATLSFAVKEQTETTIRLYNTLGQQVATVYEGTPQAGEQRAAQVDVSSLPSGTYFLRLQAEGKTATRRLTVVQ